MLPGATETRTCTFLLDGEGIVYARVRDGAEMDIADAKEALEATARLTGGRRRPALVDLRRCKSQTRDCRLHFSGEDAARVTLAAALLIGSPVSRVIGNFYLGLNRLAMPTRLFTSEADALEWLRAFAR